MDDKLNQFAANINYWGNNKTTINSTVAKQTLSQCIEYLTGETDTQILKQFLNHTSHSYFLKSLETDELRNQWAETVFQAIRISEYSLLDMLEHRNNSIPDNIYFQDYSSGLPQKWTYRQVYFHVREIAAALWKTTLGNEPRVAIFSENCLESACCDLACLMYDIPVTPLNTHFNNEILEHIFNDLHINIAITDSKNRYEQLLELKSVDKESFIIYFIGNREQNEEKNLKHFGEYYKSLSGVEIPMLLDIRKRRNIKQVATVMYTSGSTGLPKGVSFSMYNLVTKRFARAAALPDVGDNETLLCFLPLYHTFGRFLEMLGMLYWNGTYTFCGNPSAETLIKYFPIVNPTGFISIPLRWSQLHEKINYETEKSNPENAYSILHSIIGSRLRWGLSAAGYLSPDTFHFFEKNHIKLCSGFGMTEATGGITMTPPGGYMENSVGKPLPGVYPELDEKGELLLSGHYITHYLEEAGFNDEIEYHDIAPYKVKTGDIFRILPSNHFEIIDRVKDIYKNNKGQTVAPRVVEQKYEGVPGINRTYLVGDGKPYNVLFIVPDLNEPLLLACTTKEMQRDYFRQIIEISNQSLAPYDRVINFEILERDFTIEQEELTPKGSFNRKNILKNFSEIINKLYKNNFIELKIDAINIRIPLWIFRDIGILEDDIFVVKNGIKNRASSKILTIKKTANFIQIGNLKYTVNNCEIDLGTIVRQPLLWCGNEELLSFYPCKEGWDISHGEISIDAHFCDAAKVNFQNNNTGHIKDSQLSSAHKLFVQTFYGSPSQASESIKNLELLLHNSTTKIGDLVRRRLFALAEHAADEIRFFSYRILLLDEPDESYDYLFSWFLNSGKKFLNHDSIEILAFSQLEKRRLEALRKRLYSYRINLALPASETIHQQIDNVFEMLVHFVSVHPEFYNSVRAELASWILLKEDSCFAHSAKNYIEKLYKEYERKLEDATPVFEEELLSKKIVFDDNLDEKEIKNISKILYDHTFIKQSIMLAFDQETFSLDDVPENGIWIYKIPSSDQFSNYRISINTIQKKHFDLLLVLSFHTSAEQFQKAVFWLLSVAGYPFYPRVLPRIGCCRLEANALTVAYKGELDVWKRICQLASITNDENNEKIHSRWKRLFIESFAAIYRSWKNSGYKIVPALISPSNIVVTELDYHEGAILQTMTEVREYENPLTIVKQMIHNFYMKAVACYPACRNQLDIRWIFDACYEVLDLRITEVFMNEFLELLKSDDIICPNGDKISDVLEKYILQRKTKFYPTLALSAAIEEYKDWTKSNANATSYACDQTINELFRLHRINMLPEIARYFLYRHTYFKNTNQQITTAFDTLLDAMYINQNKPALQYTELSDLQMTLVAEDDTIIFSKMVFPSIISSTKIEVKKIGLHDKEQTAIHSVIIDKFDEAYTFRHPEKPAEIGNLYRLFYIENYPKIVSPQDRHYIILDNNAKIIGGICYKILDENTVLLDAMMITNHLKNRGIGKAIAEDFFNRMKALNYKVIKTHIYQKQFFEKLGFSTDSRWGERVKFLN